jgi:hypothetical protein
LEAGDATVASKKIYALPDAAYAPKVVHRLALSLTVRWALTMSATVLTLLARTIRRFSRLLGRWLAARSAAQLLVLAFR